MQPQSGGTDAHASVWYRQDLPSGLRAFLFHPTQTSAAVIHAARLGEQMFSFSSTHGGGALCSQSGVQSENPTPGGAPSLFHQEPPTSIPNDDVIFFRPSALMVRTACALLSIWKHLILTHCRYPLRLLRSYLESKGSFCVSLMESVGFCRLRALPSGQTPTDVHPSWLLNMAVTLALIKSYSRHTNPLLRSYKLLTFPATE